MVVIIYFCDSLVLDVLGRGRPGPKGRDGRWVSGADPLLKDSAQKALPRVNQSPRIFM